MTTSKTAPSILDTTFSEGWLEQCAERLMDSARGIDVSLLQDPDGRQVWWVRCAPMTHPEVCQRLQREGLIASSLSPDHALVPLGTLWTSERVVVIYPANGESTQASKLVGQRLGIDDFLTLAISATQALMWLHGSGRVHGALQPSHLIVTKGQVKLTGFNSLAQPREGGSTVLPYLAPELEEDLAVLTPQSDLYALGITFYEILTGALPFHASTDAGWKHAQVAVLPAAPSLYRDDIPPALSGVLQRLMRKEASERYNTAASLLQDLCQCRRQLTEADGGIPLSAEGAVPQDASVPSPDLVGREQQLLQLRGALDRVQRSGRSELVLIRGRAGAGKSVLAHEILSFAASVGLTTALAKCDQQQLDIPYFALAEVVRALVLSALGGGRPQVEGLRDRWLDALSGQGRAIAELVPEVEPILGRTSPLANVPAQQAHARMERVLRQTLASFSQAHAPIVVFIDDLQWADRMTRAFIESFVVEAPQGVLLVGAYRNQSSAGETLPDLYQQFVAPLHANRSDVVRVELIEASPLSEREVQELVYARLSDKTDRLALLGLEIHRRTDGNPYFTFQLLQSLLDDGLLVRHAESDWLWSRDDIRSLGYAENVVGLMVQRISRLPLEGTEVAKVLACIGTECEATLLHKVCRLSLANVSDVLRPFVDAGLILEDVGGYSFSHDRVLEAVYSLIEEGRKSALHACIALEMMVHWRDVLAEHAFTICNQIERASGHQVDGPEKVDFARAFVRAARRAKGASAIHQAAGYVDAALAYMDDAWWTAEPDLVFEARLLQCECLLAQANITAAESAVRWLLARRIAPLQQAAIHRLDAVLHTIRSDYEGAIDAALSGLQLLDMSLQRHPSDADMRSTYDRVMLKIGDRKISDLARLPPCKDPRVQTAMGLLATLVSSFFVRDGISFSHTAAMVELTLDRGVTPESIHGLAWFGVFVAGRFDAFQDGLDFGLTAMELADQNGYEAERISALVAVDQVAVWTRPLEYALHTAQRAVTQGMASGDVGMACYARNHIVSDQLAIGQTLQLVMEDITKGLELTREVQYLDIELIILSQKYFADSLVTGLAGANPSALGSRLMASAEELIARANSLPTHFWTWLYHGMAAYYHHLWPQAMACLSKAEELMWSAPAHINTADAHLYFALALGAASRHQATGTMAPQETIDRLKACKARFSQWAGQNPGTFHNKLLLVEGELFLVQGDVLKALACFERAAQAAAAAGFWHENALAHELAGTVAATHGVKVAASQHFRLACEAYERWGASAKTDSLRAQAFLEPSLEPSQKSTTPPSSETTVNAALELSFQAAEALSGAGPMGQLMDKLMTSLIVHSGAQYGALVLLRNGEAVVEASGRVVRNGVEVVRISAPATERTMPLAVLNSVLRSAKPLVVGDASESAMSTRWGEDSALRSILCLPLFCGTTLFGALYLENSLAPNVFNQRRVDQMSGMLPQVVTSLLTAQLYEKVMDETQRRLDAEVSLRAARADLVTKSHLTVLANLAASIAHEINQPLASIVTSADAGLRWLRRSEPNLEEVGLSLSSVRSDGMRAAEIIRALRALAKQAPPQAATIYLDTMVQEVLDLMRAEIEIRSTRLITNLHSGAAIDADKSQLQQVVLNLVRNALDAMADTPQELRELEILTVASARGVSVVVRDRGVGIALSLEGRIFEPFFTTKAQGLGMGLSICQSIVEAHGGRLTGTSRPSGGSEFVFNLPLAAAVDASPAALLALDSALRRARADLGWWRRHLKARPRRTP